LTDCVAITRAGNGDIWLFPSRSEAQRHPLVQYGDPIMREVDDLFHEYCLLEFPKFLPKIIKPELYQRLMARADELQIAKTPERVVALRIKEEFGNSIWGALVIAAQPVPGDPDVVIDLVQRDRDIIYGERKMAKAPAKNAAPAEEEGEPRKRSPSSCAVTRCRRS
jgi:hypothetical protein